MRAKPKFRRVRVAVYHGDRPVVKLDGFVRLPIRRVNGWLVPFLTDAGMSLLEALYKDAENRAPWQDVSGNWSCLDEDGETIMMARHRIVLDGQVLRVTDTSEMEFCFEEFEDAE